MSKTINRNKPAYPVVDLFAGPGGLGEGFASSYDSTKTCKLNFRSIAAIEKDEFSYQTLLLRHFFRSFEEEHVPDDYYNYLADKITKEELIAKNSEHWDKAENTTLQITLGAKTHNTIKNELKLRLSENSRWVLVGGPPCQSYSIVGRSRMMQNPEFENDERHTLYQEYLQILTDHKPPVFVMENVKGLLSAQLRGELTIHKIIEDLRKPPRGTKKSKSNLEYKLYSFSQSGEIAESCDPRAFIVKAEEYGIPQARHRIFILGIRSDINIAPSTLKPEKSPSIEQIIGDLPKIRSGISKQKDTLEIWKNALTSNSELGWMSFNGENNGKIKKEIKSALVKIQNSTLTKKSTRYRVPSGSLKKWFYDERLCSISSHEARSHMKSDLHRYLYSSSYAQALSTSPKLSDFPTVLLPAHNNVNNGNSNFIFSDRFRVQLKDKASTTITSHISKDGHYFIHYDPSQCRSLSVREAARLQTFPDNYHFEGPRTSQYHQIGNAVPPYLAIQIANIVKDILDQMPGD